MISVRQEITVNQDISETCIPLLDAVGSSVNIQKFFRRVFPNFLVHKFINSVRELVKRKILETLGSLNQGCALGKILRSPKVLNDEFQGSWQH